MPRKYFDFKIISLWAILGIIATVIIKIGSQDTLDSRFFYTGAEAANYLKSLSDKELNRYFVTEFFDLGFIITYTAILFISLKRIFYKKEKIKYFALIPAAFDLFETKTIMECISTGADISREYGWLGYITLFKWIMLAFLLLLFLIKFSRAVYIKFRK